jgi:hypothetical protein
MTFGQRETMSCGSIRSYYLRARCQPRLYNLWLLIASAVCLSMTGVSAQADSAGKTLGFVVSDIYFANYEGPVEQVCPDGMAVTQREYALQSLPEADRDHLKSIGREATSTLHNAATKMFKAECLKPDEVADPGLRTVGGSIAFGLNLDGSTSANAASPNTCPHQKFESPTGEPGVDNQLFRVIGCIVGFRKTGHFEANGDAEDNYRTGYRSGEHTVLIELTGVKDARNDNDVQVGIYSSSDPAPFDATGRPLPGASLQVHDNPHFHNLAHGKIVDGVLTTDPIDLHLQFILGVSHSEYYLRGARLRMTLRPDGTASGLLAGYYDVDTFYDGHVRRMGIAVPEEYGLRCAGVYNALNRFADGYRDPKTGRCTAISSAFRIDAIHAFVIHPKDEKKTTAQADPLVQR